MIPIEKASELPAVVGTGQPSERVSHWWIELAFGSADDLPGQDGMAWTVVNVIANHSRSLGLQTTASVGRDRSQLHWVCPAELECVEPIVASLVAPMLTEPGLAELGLRDTQPQTPMGWTDVAMMATVFAGHPYGGMVAGDPLRRSTFSAVAVDAAHRRAVVRRAVVAGTDAGEAAAVAWRSALAALPPELMPDRVMQAPMRQDSVSVSVVPTTGDKGVRWARVVRERLDLRQRLALVVGMAARASQAPEGWRAGVGDPTAPLGTWAHGGERELVAWLAVDGAAADQEAVGTVAAGLWRGTAELGAPELALAKSDLHAALTERLAVPGVAALDAARGLRRQEDGPLTTWLALLPGLTVAEVHQALTMALQPDDVRIVRSGGTRAGEDAALLQAFSTADAR